MKRINEWLNEDSERRILMLLDEADLFLSKDRLDGFSRLGIVNIISLESENRFKVVLAGLHDVQRTSRDVNATIHQSDTTLHSATYV